MVTITETPINLVKTVQDKDGNVVEVPMDTPCHAGKNGALPIMLCPVLDKEVFDEIEARELEYISQEPERVRQGIISQIVRLESEITPRRLREAILGTDNGWLANQETLISTERNKLQS